MSAPIVIPAVLLLRQICHSNHLSFAVICTPDNDGFWLSDYLFLKDSVRVL